MPQVLYTALLSVGAIGVSLLFVKGCRLLPRVKGAGLVMVSLLLFILIMMSIVLISYYTQSGWFEGVAIGTALAFDATFVIGLITWHSSVAPLYALELKSTKQLKMVQTIIGFFVCCGNLIFGFVEIATCRQNNQVFNMTIALNLLFWCFSLTFMFASTFIHTAKLSGTIHQVVLNRNVRSNGPMDKKLVGLIGRLAIVRKLIVPIQCVITFNLIPFPIWYFITQSAPPFQFLMLLTTLVAYLLFGLMVLYLVPGSSSGQSLDQPRTVTVEQQPAVP